MTEGVATAQVLISGEESGNSVKAIGLGALICGLVSLCETMGVFDHHTGEGWFYKNIYPNSLVILPPSANLNGRWDESELGTTTAGPFSVGNVSGTYFGRTRYICVDMILVGGAWSLILIRKAMVTTVRAG